MSSALHYMIALYEKRCNLSHYSQSHILYRERERESEGVILYLKQELKDVRLNKNRGQQVIIFRWTALLNAGLHSNSISLNLERSLVPSYPSSSIPQVPRCPRHGLFIPVIHAQSSTLTLGQSVVVVLKFLLSLDREALVMFPFQRGSFGLRCSFEMKAVLQTVWVIQTDNSTFI